MVIKKVLCFLLVLVAAGTVVSCARTPQLTKPARAEGAEGVRVTGDCTAELVDGGETLRVTGKCSLMDGTNGIVVVLDANGSTVAQRKFTKESDDLSFDFEVTQQWPKTVYAFISFDTQQCDKQPEAVTELYGKRFQNLEGPYVIWDTKGVIAVFQSDPVTVPMDI